MKLFKISTIALAMALTGWVACGDGGKGNTGGTGGNTLPSTGGTVPVDTATAGTGGSTGSLDAGADTGRDTASGPDASDTSLPPIVDGGIDVDMLPPVDGSPTPNICTDLTPAQCHDVIINAATDPSVSALDPGANPPVPYPNCNAL